MFANTNVTIQSNDIVQLNAPRRSRGWQYLLSDSLAFRKEHVASHGNAIRIQKPNEEQVPQWIKRLITAGQCEAIYVENLSLSEDEKLAIKALCTEFSVSLIGLTVNDANIQNVVRGPW